MTTINSSYGNYWREKPLLKNALSLKHSLAHILWASVTMALLSTSAYASDEQTPDHIGKISAEYLLSTYPEFAKEYANFDPSAAQLRDIQALAGKEVTTLFGTWCHDSKREVPRLLKLLELANVPVKQLTLVAVSRQKDDPEGYSEKYELEYTPTIVISDGGIEIARIIERPKGSLAQDIANQINQAK